MILYYPGSNLAKQDVVKQVLQANSHPYKLLTKDDVNNTIASLMELHHTPIEGIHESIDLDILIFHEVEDEDITRLSQALRAQDAHVERKAVLTKHNKDWTLIALLQEIALEHRYYVAYDLLKQNLMQTNDMKESAYEQSSWIAYQTSFMDAYMIYQNPDKTLEDMEQVNQAYELALQSLQLK